MSLQAATLTRDRVSIHRSANPRRVLQPFIIWLGLMAYVVLAKLLLDAFLPQAFASPDQAALFGWLPITAISAAGIVGVWFAQRTGFAPAWTSGVGIGRQVLVPAVLGFAIAMASVAFDLVTHNSAIKNAAHGVDRQYTDFPSMLLIFTAAGVYVEPIYRLLLIPLPLWLISTVLLRGRGQTPVFWVLAVLASLFEPVDQIGQSIQDLGLAQALLLMTLGFSLNMLQVVFFRRYGFVSSIAAREGYYLLWHVLYIH
jgi:hypothetical protein